MSEEGKERKTSEIDEWLSSIKLKKYIPAFNDDEIDLNDLKKWNKNQIMKFIVKQYKMTEMHQHRLLEGIKLLKPNNLADNSNNNNKIVLNTKKYYHGKQFTKYGISGTYFHVGGRIIESSWDFMYNPCDNCSFIENRGENKYGGKLMYKCNGHTNKPLNKYFHGKIFDKYNIRGVYFHVGGKIIDSSWDFGFNPCNNCVFIEHRGERKHGGKLMYKCNGHNVQTNLSHQESVHLIYY